MVKESKELIKHYKDKLDFVYGLFGRKSLQIGYDNLVNSEVVSQEILYFKDKLGEKKGIFVFSFPFFIRELEDDDFKKMLGYNSLNFKINQAYIDLKNACSKKKGCKGVLVNDILNKVCVTGNNVTGRPKVLRRILTLSYYLGWNLIKSSDSIDTDYYVEIPDDFLRKQKQRFNLDIALLLNETEEFLLFVNMKGDLSLVLKQRVEFSKEYVEGSVLPYLKGRFEIGSISID